MYLQKLVMKRVEKWEIYKVLLVWRVAKDEKLFLSTAAQDSKKRKVRLVFLKPLVVVNNLIFYFHFFESFPKNTFNSSNFRKPQ